MLKLNFPVLILWLIAVCLVSSCGVQEKEVEALLPVRLLDDPDFLDQIREINTATAYVEDSGLSGRKWDLVYEDRKQGSRYYRLPAPLDCSPILQFLRGKEAPLLAADGTEIPYAADVTALQNLDSGWTFDRRLVFRFEKVVKKKPHIVQNLDFRFNSEFIEITFRKLPVGSVVAIEMDGRQIGQLKGRAEGRAHFRKRIKAGRGKHRLEIRLQKGKGTINRLTSISIGEDGVLLVKEPVSEAGKRSSIRFHYNRIDPFVRNLITAIRGNLFRHFNSENYPLDSAVFSTRLTNPSGTMMETRRSVNLLPGYHASFRIRLPENPSALHLSYAYFAGAKPKGNALIVRISAKGDLQQVVTHTITLERMEKEVWYPRTIDLSNYAGREINVEFEYSAAGDNPFHLLLGEPVITGAESIHGGRKNIILVSMDTMRGDRTGVAGFSRQVTPAFDRVARDGAVFSQAYSQTGWTLPSHKSMLTGIYPFAAQYLSSRFLNLGALPHGIPTLASYLKSAKYRTVAFTGGGFLSAHYGFYKDFDAYTEFNDQKGRRIRYGGQRRIVKENGWRSAYRWLAENHNSGPFFLFLHTYGPHIPYSSFGYEEYFRELEPPTKLPPDIVRPIKEKLDENDCTHLELVYDRNLRRSTDELDHLLGLLRRLEIEDETLLVITSDHGELLGEHEVYADHGTVWDEVLHIPMVFHLPGTIPAGRVVDRRVHLVDLFPTVMDLLGLGYPDYVQGRSLLPYLTGQEPDEWNDTVFASHYMGLSAVMEGKYKYITEWKGETNEQYLFDLSTDPDESRNLLEEGNDWKELSQRLSGRIAFYLAEQVPGWNILLTPPQAVRIRVNVDFYDFADSGAGQTRKNFTIGPVRAYINHLQAETEGSPLLMMLEDPTASKPFGIRLEIYDEDSGQWNELHLPVSTAFREGNKRVPIRIDPSRPVQDIPSFLEGIPDELLQKYSVFIWRSRLPFAVKAGIQEVSLTNRDLRALRDLGYLN